jgi:hypothetical protein
MPHSGHNADFRAREHKFTPSSLAIEEARARGIEPGTTQDAWRVMSDSYLDTFQRYFEMTRPGDTMSF